VNLKDVKVGERYAAVHFWRPTSHGVGMGARFRVERLSPLDFEGLSKAVKIVEVVEVGVPVGSYARPGVLVKWFDPETGEPWPSASRNGEDPFRPVPIRTLNLLLPWDKFVEQWEEVVERAQAAREEKDREQERRQEKAAKEWMERVMADARSDIVQVMAAVNATYNAETNTAASYAPTDEEIRRLVEMRHPEGNPYLGDDPRRAY
jgi:hypothetical protein